MSPTKSKIKEYTLNFGNFKSTKSYEVLNPYDQSIIAKVGLANEVAIEEALTLSKACFKMTMSKLKAYERSEILGRVASIMATRKLELATIIAKEGGKPIKDSKIEVDRAINTFNIASRLALTLEGKQIPMDISPLSEDRFAYSFREPLGIVLAITPFNFPLNLVTHKVAPAIACGNTVILKPASQTPISSLLLQEIFAEAQLPDNALIVLCLSGSATNNLVSSSRIAALSFTGSPQVGWNLPKQVANGVKCILELGGNAAAIVHHDADIELAASSLCRGSFAHAGQICISVQRIYVHNDIYDEFIKLFINKVKELKFGNPLDDTTDIGPMINAGAVENTLKFANEAISQGAKVLLQGENLGNNICSATVLANTDPQMRVMCEEVFGPIVCINKFNNLNAVIHEVNNSDYGIQASLFTKSMDTSFEAISKIDTTGVLINDSPSFRADHIPYGGRKNSGMGLEGVAYAMDEMVKTKFVSFKLKS